MNDSDLGFYHSGLLFRSKEYTYCQDLGIIHHEPRLCTYSTYLGSVRLGRAQVHEEDFDQMIEGMCSNYEITSVGSKDANRETFHPLLTL